MDQNAGTFNPVPFLRDIGFPPQGIAVYQFDDVHGEALKNHLAKEGLVVFYMKAGVDYITLSDAGREVLCDPNALNRIRKENREAQEKQNAEITRLETVLGDLGPVTEWTDCHWLDGDENPEGGHAYGRGFAIAWQRGPLGPLLGGNRKIANGAFVEDVLAACVGRLRFLNGGKFHCEENDRAVAHINAAIGALQLRTKRRVNAGTEGTNEGS